MGLKDSVCMWHREIEEFVRIAAMKILIRRMTIQQHTAQPVSEALCSFS